MDVLHKVKMDFLTKPQIVVNAEKSVPYSVFDGLWIPYSAKFVVLGSKPKGTGIIQIYQLSGGNCTLISETVQEHSFKCGTFGASPSKCRHLATGNFAGQLEIWDLEDCSKPISSYEAHNKIINCVDGFGGQSVCCGAPEIATGSRDGSVKLWDTRQHGKPVAVMEPADGEDRRDCWSITIGNSYNNTERVVCAGYDNGDIKMFDLRKLNVRWETNIKNGVCGLEFDRKDIEMNKLIATTLESKFHMFDTRVQHPKKGFGCSVEKAHSSTVWFVRHSPHNREVFMTGGGNGSLCLWKYNYPENRVKEDSDGVKYSIAGKAELLQNITVTNQPIAAFQWCQDKPGLAIATSFDQAFRIYVVTNLNLI